MFVLMVNGTEGSFARDGLRGMAFGVSADEDDCFRAYRPMARLLDGVKRPDVKKTTRQSDGLGALSGGGLSGPAGL
jgi:hypothetical protein